MAIEKMKLFKISGPVENMSKVSAKLFESECFHPKDASKLFSANMGFIPYIDEAPYAEELKSIEELSKNNGFSLEVLNVSELSQFSDSDAQFLGDIRKKLQSYSDEIKSLNEQKEICEAGIKSFEHFKGLEVDLDDISECKFIRVRFGHMPKESFKRLNTVYKDNPYVIFYPCSEDETDYWGAYFAPVDMLDEIDQIFAFMFFEPVKVPGAAGTIEEAIKNCEDSIKIDSEQLEEIDKAVKELINKEKDRINYIYSTLLYLNANFELHSYAVHNGRKFVLVGFVPKSEAENLKSSLEELDGVSADFEDASKTESDIPVKYKKRKAISRALVDPYKFYVDMYGTPSYSDIDITSFVALTYTILFGIMFGDLGQGFVLMIVGILMWKLKKMGLGKILIPCGISSMFFGFMFGSVFGFEEMLDPVYHALGWAGKPLSVMESINTVLLIAIAIGVGLMVVAILMNIYACIKRKQIGEALFSQNGLAGLLLYLAGVNLASGFMKGPAPIPSNVCAMVLVVCAFLLFIKEIPIGIIDKHPNWKPESVSDFILQNLFELLEYILSYLSNTVSFLRVGAFVLVHAGMMMVVFSLAGDSENLFVIILGNILVIALEGLLTGIQALRLEYYEMFSRFFDGSGVSFNPIKLIKNKD